MKYKNKKGAEDACVQKKMKRNENRRNEIEARYKSIKTSYNITLS